MNLKFTPITIAVRGSTEGHLVFLDDSLVAILVLLGNLHEDNAGKWYMETAFHESMVGKGHIFGSIIEAENWIRGCLASSGNRHERIHGREPERP